MTGLLNRRRASHRVLCGLLAALMAASPAPMVAQQPVAPSGNPPAELDDDYALPDACLVIAARPGQVLKAPAFAMFPIEVLQAAMLQQLGVDPLTSEQVLVSIVPPTQGPPGYSFHATFDAPVSLKLENLPVPFQEQQVGQRRIWKEPSGNPMSPGLYLPGDRAIVAFDDASAAKLPGGATRQVGPLLAKFQEAYQGDDLLAMLDVEPLRPLYNAMLAQSPAPPELAPFTQLPNLVKTVELRLNLSRPGISELIVTANNEADAFRLMRLYDQARAIAAAQVAAQSKQMTSSADPVEQAMGRYMERMTSHWNEQTNLTHDGAQVIVFRAEGTGEDRMQVVGVAVIGVLVALLLPAVQAARAAAGRNSSMNNIKQILLALLNYESAKAAMPAYANFDADGKPLLSWRVHVLPYMEHQALYNQFHLDEPWDSPHNKALIPQMPEIYRDPGSMHTTADGLTNYLGVKGEGRYFDGTSEGRKIMTVTDGTSNTIMVVQVDDNSAVPWTKPDDWELDDANPTGAFAGIASEIFLAGYGDGHVSVVSTFVDADTLKAMLTIGGGEAPPMP
jgi:hypothetical protein